MSLVPILTGFLRLSQYCDSSICRSIETAVSLKCELDLTKLGINSVFSDLMSDRAKEKAASTKQPSLVTPLQV